MAHSVFIQVPIGMLEENCEQGVLGIMLSIFKVLTNFFRNSLYLAANRTIRFEASQDSQKQFNN